MKFTEKRKENKMLDIYEVTAQISPTTIKVFEIAAESSKNAWMKYMEKNKRGVVVKVEIKK